MDMDLNKESLTYINDLAKLADLIRTSPKPQPYQMERVCTNDCTAHLTTAKCDCVLCSQISTILNPLDPGLGLGSSLGHPTRPNLSINMDMIKGKGIDQIKPITLNPDPEVNFYLI